MIQLNRCLQPPVESYVQPGATLYCELASSLANEIVTVTYRLIELEKGTIHLDAVSSTVPPGDGISFNVSANLPECFLFAISVTCNAAQMRGETYVRVKLKSKDGKHLTTFLRGYITNTQGLSYPPIYLQDSLSGSGAFKVANIGWELPFTFIVPAKRLIRPLSISFQFQASAVVADRVAYVRVQNSSGGSQAEIFAHDIVASQQEMNYNFIRGVNSGTTLLPGSPDTKYNTTGLGDLELPAAWRLYVDVVNRDVGDSTSYGFLLYEEFLTP
jgi:hypothetical protein